MKPSPIPIRLRKVGILFALFLLASLVLMQVNAQTGGSFTLTRWTVANGGAMFSTGGSFKLGGTLGQPSAGNLSGGTFTARSGFWSIAPGQPTCEPISGVHLSRTPAGDVFTGNTVRFTADANGTTPFTYTWTLNGVPVGENLSAFEYTFNAAGTFTVSVTVANACGQGSDAMVVLVQALVPGQPDLSSSLKSVNLTQVESGDTLTYTLWLRNTSAMTATAILTDPVPISTTYILGSAQVSDGSAVTVSNGELHWSGRIISGTPIVIEFAADSTDRNAAGRHADYQLRSPGRWLWACAAARGRLDLQSGLPVDDQ